MRIEAQPLYLTKTQSNIWRVQPQSTIDICRPFSILEGIQEYSGIRDTSATDLCSPITGAPLVAARGNSFGLFISSADSGVFETDFSTRHIDPATSEESGAKVKNSVYPDCPPALGHVLVCPRHTGSY